MGCSCNLFVICILNLMFQSQAQECVFESKVLGGVEGILGHVKAAQEAIVVRYLDNLTGAHSIHCSVQVAQ